MTDFLARWNVRFFNTAEPGAGGGGGEAPPADGGTPAIVDPAAGGAAGPGGEGGEGGEGAKSSTPWWQDTKRFDDKTQTMLKAKGLTVDDPLEAMQKLAGMYSNAETFRGKPVDQLMEKPKQGQEVSEWMKANGDLFGIPEKPEDYKIEKPESWPKDAPWDDKAEAKLREKAHELGLNSAQTSAMAGIYADIVTETLGGAEAGGQQARAQLEAELKKGWGDEYPAKVARAQQAWQVAAEQAGLDADGALNAAQMLSGKDGEGDANVLRLFAALGDMMGEDVLPRVGGNGGSLGVTPAEARAELETMLSPDSEYSKAVKARRQGQHVNGWDALEARRQHLTKLAAKS